MLFFYPVQPRGYVVSYPRIDCLLAGTRVEISKVSYDFTGSTIGNLYRGTSKPRELVECDNIFLRIHNSLFFFTSLFNYTIKASRDSRDAFFASRVSRASNRDSFFAQNATARVTEPARSHALACFYRFLSARAGACTSILCGSAP